VSSRADIIGMVAPMIRVRGSSVIQVPAPSNYYVGLTYEREGFKVFHHRLSQLIESRTREELPVSTRTRWVLDRYEYLDKTFPRLWEDHREANRTINSRPLDFLEAIHDCWDETTAYFLKQQADGAFEYRHLIVGHINRAVRWYYDSTEEGVKEHGEEETFDLVRWIALGMHQYFDTLDEFARHMARKGCKDHDLAIEAWLMLMMRAFCWHRAHFMVKGSRVPSEFYESRMPIYIG
jgi:hypothetical protein